ncbi:MAG TPA: outer membrane protein assembly factor BamD, partial [Ktedonobacterales bacterium]|nr:outer membrane protein assembly factor BamD [Ktedonobacterales bacterium]
MDTNEEPADADRDGAPDERALPAAEDMVAASTAPEELPSTSAPITRAEMPSVSIGASSASTEQDAQPAPAALPRTVQQPTNPTQQYPYPVAYPTGPYVMPPGAWYPSSPGMYPMPPNPGYPVYPAYPGYPGHPMQPGIAPFPEAVGPSTSPSWQPDLIPPGMSPETYALIRNFREAQLAPRAPRKPRPPLRALITQPFPRWFMLMLWLIAAALVIYTYLETVKYPDRDWADGAEAAGIVALVFGGVALLLFTARLIGGRRARPAILFGLLAVVILAGIGATSLVISPQLHHVQALHDEQNGMWDTAIHEYELAGENTANAADVARVYDEWGEQQLRDKNYRGAVDRFNVVVANYTDTGRYLKRANDDLFATYSDWIQSGLNVPYGEATAFFDSYRTLPQCDSSCASRVNAIEARSYYEYGVQLASEGDYQDAILQFEVIQSRYPNSPYFHQAHLYAAQAYYALALQETSSNCSDAVSAYTTLVSEYADTPEAKKA